MKLLRNSKSLIKNRNKISSVRKKAINKVRIKIINKKQVN